MVLQDQRVKLVPLEVQDLKDSKDHQAQPGHQDLMEVRALQDLPDLQDHLGPAGLPDK